MKFLSRIVAALRVQSVSVAIIHRRGEIIVSPECKALPAVSRVASAAGAVAITSVLLLAVGLGFSARASAEGAARPATSAPATKAMAMASGAAAAPALADSASIARGRYLVAISGCNDCHTAGYSETGGKVAQSDWLLGQPVGFRGPWGVSYPANLRLTVQSVTEAEWLKFARVERLPPMPWFALRDMSDDDLRAMYRFIRSLGAKGERMPAALAPNASVRTPYIQFTPQNLPAMSQAAPTGKQGGRG
jgi:mono/diheme cytochrome c family protein